MRQFDQRCVPTSGTDCLVLPAETRAALQEVIHFEKARSVLFGEWGYGDLEFGATAGGDEDGEGGGGASSVGASASAAAAGGGGVGGGGGGVGGGMGDQQGATVMLWGAAGTGKSRMAEAIGFEVGRPLKVVNFQQAANSAGSSAKDDGGASDDGGGASGVRAIFDDARLMQVPTNPMPCIFLACFCPFFVCFCASLSRTA